MNVYDSVQADAIAEADDETRIEWAKNGQYLGYLINDRSWKVRLAVAEREYMLDVLAKDLDWMVRREVAKRGVRLDLLVSDADPRVRQAVAEQGYGLVVLGNDLDSRVQFAAKVQIAANRHRKIAAKANAQSLKDDHQFLVNAVNKANAELREFEKQHGIQNEN